MLPYKNLGGIFEFFGAVIISNNTLFLVNKGIQIQCAKAIGFILAQIAQISTRGLQFCFYCVISRILILRQI